MVEVVELGWVEVHLQLLAKFPKHLDHPMDPFVLLADQPLLLLMAILLVVEVLVGVVALANFLP